MEISRPKRLLVSLEAEIILGNFSIQGFISNLSEKGVFIRTDSIPSGVSFDEGSRVTLKFRIPSGDEISMPCMIAWAKKSQNVDRSLSMGMEIIECSQPFKDFITGRVNY